MNTKTYTGFIPPGVTPNRTMGPPHGSPTVEEKRSGVLEVLDDLKLLVKTFPMRQEALFRVLLAARLEADNRTGEIFGNNPAKRLMQAAGLKHQSTFDQAIS